MKLVKIVWIDAIGQDGWTSINEVEKETPVFHNSVGYLVKETEGFVTITMSYSDDIDNLGAWVVIPKVMIVNFTEI